ncbi:MAG: hypothetical protein GY830_07335 [Bacteroidetes bacterium]|nr:hypothetical protein [Bacteroidota bacterium]
MRIENIGDRGLHTIMSHILNEYMFDVPGKIKPNQKIPIDKKFITSKLNKLIKNKDLSEYIL